MDNHVVISTKSLYKIYDESTIPVPALKDVNLTINKGSFVAIVGPSGSGKTTLLNIIGGLDTPSSGKVFVDGRELSEMSESQLIDFRRDHIGFVFQSFNLIPVLTAKENAEFVMLLQGRSQKERNERIFSLFNAVGLQDKTNSRPCLLYTSRCV